MPKEAYRNYVVLLEGNSFTNFFPPTGSRPLSIKDLLGQHLLGFRLNLSTR